jgi:hypothetical protein
MNLKAIAAAAAVLTVGSSAVAFAQTTAPVTIVSSVAVPRVADASIFEQGFVRYAFVNNSAVAATEVDFTLQANGETLATYRDLGTFTKGVQIARFVATDATAPDQHLTLDAVKFADGTVWTNDAVAPQALRQADVSLETGN